MAVSAKEKKLLQNMWEGAEDTPESSLPDGKYQFKITNATFEMSSSDKPRIVSEMKVIGGNEEFIGEEVTIYDNLETPENMSWFKRKLKRLKVDIPEDFEELMDGTITKQMKGTTFEGQAKNKDGFFNVYVNRSLGEGEEGEETGEEEETQEETQEEQESQEEDKLEVDDCVTFTFKGEKKKGTIIEVLDDDEMVRVKEDDSGKIFKVKQDKVEIVYEEETQEETEEGEEGEEGKKFPTPSAVKKMNKKDISTTLEKVGLDSDEISDPKNVAITLAEVIAGNKVNKKALTAAVKAFGRKVKPTDDEKKLLKSLSAEIDAALME